MKYLVFISLLLAGCGSTHDDSPTIVEQAKASPSPSPEPHSTSLIVGNWIDAKGNTLQFKENFTATSNSQKFNWVFDQDNNIVFDLGAVEFDKCSYQVSSKGTLVTPPVIALNLSCQNSGQLSYTKSDL